MEHGRRHACRETKLSDQTELPMNLSLDDDQEMMRDSFVRFTMARK